MQYKLLLTPFAERDLDEALQWYNTQQEKLGFRFIATVEDYFIRILQYPKSYPIKSNSNREAYIKKFPYVIIYGLKESTQEIVIYRIFNTHQNPEKKPK
ncbi:type II toxin-antitoxin system RelE/ParE family toxin [Apibacter muscae]|uniref:type II toxin-antitoxin system RelE/ParE family toxin n=1 Tax=Apibacter muscae TaxID=2509004 RepID=UPI0011ABC16E|nr:type II toxin-antitoxin system RelE/ParE family toxin [Apibacter muscae]TWP31586.1 type II toxin-antitoxin system RelE/ParE family toxin [Apibacter muscae]